MSARTSLLPVRLASCTLRGTFADDGVRLPDCRVPEYLAMGKDRPAPRYMGKPIIPRFKNVTARADPKAETTSRSRPYGGGVHKHPVSSGQGGNANARFAEKPGKARSWRKKDRHPLGDSFSGKSLRLSLSFGFLSFLLRSFNAGLVLVFPPPEIPIRQRPITPVSDKQ